MPKGRKRDGSGSYDQLLPASRKSTPRCVSAAEMIGARLMLLKQKAQMTAAL